MKKFKTYQLAKQFYHKSRSHLKNAIRDNSFRKNTSFALYKKFYKMASTQNE